MKSLTKARESSQESFLQGRTIYLRNLTSKDIPIWYKWFNDSRVTEYMNKGFYPNTKAKQKEYFNRLMQSKNDLQLGIVLKENAALIGIVGIHKINWIHRHAEVSIVVGDKDQWGRGRAKEAIALIVKHAFTKMNLRRLTAGMTALNQGSRRCFENNGFVLEGISRKHFFYKGNYVDVYILGLLMEEWYEK